MSRRSLLACLLLGQFACQKATIADPAARPGPAPVPIAAAATAQVAPVGAAGLLAEGSELPDVSALQQDGTLLKLRDLKGKPLVVYFYPKDDTPGCTIEAKEIRDLYGELKSTSATILGVSSDNRDSHIAFANKYQLPFVLLDDSGHALATAFGVSLSSGHAQRVTFVFDAAGKLRKLFPHVNPTGHAAEILGVLKTLG